MNFVKHRFTNPPIIAVAFQLCCYSGRSGALMGREDGGGGYTFLYHPAWYARKNMLRDRLPREWCCEKSDRCWLFYEERPMDKCFNFAPPFISAYTLLVGQNAAYLCVRSSRHFQLSFRRRTPRATSFARRNARCAFFSDNPY